MGKTIIMIIWAIIFPPIIYLFNKLHENNAFLQRIWNTNGMKVVGDAGLAGWSGRKLGPEQRVPQND